MLLIWNRLFLRKNKFPADITQIIFIGYEQTDVMEKISWATRIIFRKLLNWTVNYSTSVTNNPQILSAALIYLFFHKYNETSIYLEYPSQDNEVA